MSIVHRPSEVGLGIDERRNNRYKRREHLYIQPFFCLEKRLKVSPKGFLVLKFMGLKFKPIPI